MSKAELVSAFVERQTPPEGDLPDETACAQAELQKQKSSSLLLPLSSMLALC